jgi:hypothetical protein
LRCAPTLRACKIEELVGIGWIGGSPLAVRAWGLVGRNTNLVGRNTRCAGLFWELFCSRKKIYDIKQKIYGIVTTFDFLFFL